MLSLTASKRWPRLPLALEITIIIIVKLALLFVLWKLFFSEPQTKKMRMPTDLVEQHFLTNRAGAAPAAPLINPATVTTSTTPSATTDLPPPSLTPEAPHDSH
ncbi:cytochrome oxidase putative small subunit CydP [Glaciimonas sp. PCH181]|uniref:cytochrome oxidase putative small subunit CydP n=1 Tax=Glaciimonas sp. PCH181 TaxID=2133943 RepID=UPI00191C6E36|nr:cytochrome oxidase putative small subunit CydP [Glaciimonas sp. PCH181]